MTLEERRATGDQIWEEMSEDQRECVRGAITRGDFFKSFQIPELEKQQSVFMKSLGKVWWRSKLGLDNPPKEDYKKLT
eukprot:CAMPEP_0196595262 /NCGR_PEP_ID=MMETSP1081-20130531/80652_1 /TAXON_ID=36882 /ORGANISM="Pyramimonas amylifera, Strain CCMP720" /LENGTH=77 /DNA_ID=CAMNT_0041919773 /DNA_START=32 /DNA_END=261 /DNA_ORIENTATION=+